MVDLKEVDAPHGETPVHWTLFTNEPIDTAADVSAVVDMYCLRWLIEEFFKALKTGCLAERRQLDSIDAYLTFLAFAMPVAVKMLQLRTLARAKAKCPDAVLSKTQQTILVNHPRCRLPESPNAVDYLLAIAALGGFIKNNGTPGWLTLYRGFQQLLTLEIGWEAATQYHCAQQHPPTNAQSPSPID